MNSHCVSNSVMQWNEKGNECLQKRPGSLWAALGGLWPREGAVGAAGARRGCTTILQNLLSTTAATIQVQLLLSCSILFLSTAAVLSVHVFRTHSLHPGSGYSWYSSHTAKNTLIRPKCRIFTLFSWTFVGVVVLLLFSLCWRRLAASCSSWENVVKDLIMCS